MQTTGLKIGYKTKVVAEGLDISLREGEMVCLIGTNGVGKSTLLRTLAGFQPPLGGTITIGGKDLATLDRRQLSQLVSVVLTGRPRIQHITVSELVALGRTPYTNMWGTVSDDDRRIVDECISLVGINSLADRDINTLSDGECQKVMIAKALAQQTPLIILDEPTAFLDYPSKAEMLRLLSTLAHDSHKTILLSTHDLELSLRAADCALLMTSSSLKRIERDRLPKDPMEIFRSPS